MVRVVIRRLMLAAIAASLVGVPTVFATASAGAATKPAAQAAAVSWPTVRPGAKGERVRTIQLLLNQRGYALAVDGVYGSSTTNAVKAFQKVIKVSADGRVGPSTWPKLVIAIKRGSKDNAVLAVERWLRFVYGYKSVTVDQDFGPRTDAAVRNVQFNHRLRVDGVVGASTWQVIVAG